MAELSFTIIKLDKGSFRSRNTVTMTQHGDDSSRVISDNNSLNRQVDFGDLLCLSIKSRK